MRRFEGTTSKRIGLIRWPNAIKTFLLATVNLSLLPRPRSKLSLSLPLSLLLRSSGRELWAPSKPFGTRESNAFPPSWLIVGFSGGDRSNQRNPPPFDPLFAYFCLISRKPSSLINFTPLLCLFRE